MAYRKYVLFVLVLCSLLLMSIAHLGGAIHPATALADNLLVNGNFDQLPFDWFYPNHFVARGWNRWWIHGTTLPEFDDVAKPNGVRVNIYVDGGHAQVYFKWGNAYTAGLFQVVGGLTPCRPYELTMYARTHSLEGAHPGSRIGLDPWGAQLTPDGAVKDPTPLQRAVWSPEQTALFVWEQLSVTAEPIGNSLTAILYAAPTPGSAEVHYFDTFWDAGKLQALTFPAGLPNPASWDSAPHITAILTSTSGTAATIDWQTTVPALTEVRYEIIPYIAPPVEYDHHVFLPFVSKSPRLPEVNYVPGQNHTKTVSGLRSGDVVRFWVLARMAVDAACVPEGRGPFEVTIP